MSDFGLISAFRLPPEKVAKVPIADSCTATIAASFEQLVGTNEERQRHLKPERHGSLEVDDQLDLGGLLDGEISGLDAFEDSINVERSPAIHVDVIWAVRDQCAVPSRYWECEYRR